MRKLTSYIVLIIVAFNAGLLLRVLIVVFYTFEHWLTHYHAVVMGVAESE